MLTNEQKFERIQSSIADHYSKVRSTIDAAKTGNPCALSDCYKSLESLQQYLTGLLDGMSNHRKD